MSDNRLDVFDILQVSFHSYFAGQQAVNVRHWRVLETSGADVTFDEAAAFFEGYVNNAYRNLMSEDAEFLGVKVRGIFPNKTIDHINTATVKDGLVTGPPLPKQVTGLISLYSNVPGPGGRGRVYPGFPSSSQTQDDGTPDPAYVANLDALALLLKAGVTITNGAGGSADLEAGIYGRANDSFTPITTHLSRTRWATQRRRSDFGAANPANL